jgi:hypothetical protein
MTHGTNKYSTVISISYEIPYEVISFIFHISQAQVKKGMNFMWRKNNFFTFMSACQNHNYASVASPTEFPRAVG